MTRVSVIIPSYNQARFLPDALDSALSQTHDDLEIIVVDDCSEDNSRSIARQYRDRHPDRITVLENGTNLGVSRTRNRGVEASSGKYLAFLDSDDAWHEDKIRRQVDYLKQHPNTGFVHTKVSVIADEDSRKWLADNPNHLLRGVDHLEQAVNGFCDDARKFGRQDYFRTLYDSNCICNASVMARRDIFLRAGFFNHGLPSQAEDWLQWFKMCMYADPGLIPEKLAMYRFHADNHTATTFARRDYDFQGTLAEVRRMAEAHDPKRFHECLKECGRS